MRHFILFAVLVLTAAPAIAAVDQNGNQQSDVWEAKFDAEGLPAGADSDGDGVSNRDESIAGTDPFDSLSFPMLGDTPAEPGKYYALEAAADLFAPWITITNIPATNASLLAAVDLSLFTQRLFRVRVNDVYSDASGLSDWEKLQAGLSLSNMYSNGRYDLLGQAISDYAYVTGALAEQNVLSIIASDLTSTQPDPGSPAQDPGSFTILRGGIPFHAVTGAISVAGNAVEGVDYEDLPDTFDLAPGVVSMTVLLTPKANTNRTAPGLANVTLQPGAGYERGSPSSAGIVVNPSPSPAGTGLLAQYYDRTNTSFSSGQASFTNATLLVTRIDPTVNFVWNNTNRPAPEFTTNLTYLCRWSGQVQPQYSEPYYFIARSDDGTRLWVNGQLVVSSWFNQGAADRTSLPMDLVAGTRYDIVMEYYQSSGNAEAKLYWYSPSQPKQIIPSSRLYPTNAAPAAAPAVVSFATAYAILGYPFSNVVAVNNGATITSVGPMPPGLAYNASNRLIHGVPTLAGRFQINITATNAAGSASGLLDLTVIDTGAVISREIWTNVPGTLVKDIPVGTPPDVTGQLATLDGAPAFGANYGERWRGYFTAPLTGNYYFWIAASDAAELWIANDGEQVNRVRRCWVAPSHATGPQSWTNHPSQKSPWLALVAGQRYYLEVLHKVGTNGNGHVAVGWVRPDQTNALPDEVVPGQVLSPFIPAVANTSTGTLYAATMLAQGTAISHGIGTATLVLSPDETYATLKFAYTNLTTPVNGAHVHSDPYKTHPSQIIYDIDDFEPAADGSYHWEIEPAGTLSAADILEVIREGKAFINIHTVNYPAGEIRGNFTLAIGSSSFTPPPDPPAWTDDHDSTNAASRFLAQATFGPSPSDIEAVRAMGYEAWIDSQFALPPTLFLPHVLSNATADPGNSFPNTLMWNTWWRRAVSAPDQLRQRVAFALSEIFVVSDVGPLNYNARIQSAYYDVLLQNAFGNFRELLERVTLSPAMGRYLDMVANEKGNIVTGTHPNENYAREILQLFSIGLYRLWPDGTLVMNSKGTIVPTYDQQEIIGYAAAFTGWNYHQTNQANGRLPTNWYPPYPYNDTNDMTLVPTRHDLGAKRMLDNVVLPPATGLETNSANVEYDYYGQKDLELAHDTIFNNENVGPFICRQLIQRLVTSHPSREYVYRVAQKFNDNGFGVRGDMQAVIKAILLDYEARSPAVAAQPAFGKQREPLLRVTGVARAFPSPPPMTGTYAQADSSFITVTTPSGHRLASGDRARLTFTSGSPLPSPARYDVVIVNTNTFSVLAQGITTGRYSQLDTVITVTSSVHGLAGGDRVYLAFTTGGAANGGYTVVTSASLATFTVNAPDAATRNGTVVFARHSGGYAIYGQTTSLNRIKFVLNTYHGLATGDQVQAKFFSGIATNGVYVVSQIDDERTFYVWTTNQLNATESSQVIYPLVPPPLNRSGSVVLDYNTFIMDLTDTELGQTPLNSPTVFNFFFPDYKFAGILAAAGLTTPEFQLTSDTTVANQNNFLAGAVINSQGTNTSGLSSFRSGSEAITIDLGPWFSSMYAGSNGIPLMVDAMSSILMAGQLNTNARNMIINYCRTGIAYNATNPTPAQIRDRVRGAAHQLIVSPDFTIQR
jgi:uncharacterized protein (DUF1800 family)